MSEINITIPSGTSKRLLTEGKLCDNNIVVTAEGGSCEPTPTTYRVSSVYELPTDALDGSMAIVENGSIVGTWYFNETLTPLNKPFVDGNEEIWIRCDVTTAGNKYAFNNLYFLGDSTHLEEIEFGWNVAEDYWSLEESLYCGRWLVKDSRTIEILEDTDDTVFKYWVKQNATRKSGGYSLYVRENGEWVYEREIDDGYGEGYDEGYDEGFNFGFSEGEHEGYHSGYDDGKQAQYDAFWDAFQLTRKHYFYAFAYTGWTNVSYNPKYPIAPTGAEGIGHMFFINTDITDTKVPITAHGECSGAFRYAENIKRIPKLIFDSPTSVTNMFQRCISLEEIYCEGEINLSISFADSSLLSAPSAQSIIDHLKDLTGATAQTLTLHATVGGNLTDEQKAAITAKNWTLVY